MKRWFLTKINIVLASVIAFLGYGCGAKKNMVVISDKEEMREEIRVKYGVSNYVLPEQPDSVAESIVSDTVPQRPKPKVKPDNPPIMLKYGVPPRDI